MAKDKIYVFSTLSSSVAYTVWRAASANDLPQVEQSIHILGGAGVADKRIETPRGVATKIDADLLPLLEANWQFKFHRDAGHISVSDAFADADDVAADMEGRDPSAPLVPQDYKERDPENASSVGAPETTPGGKGGAKVK